MSVTQPVQGAPDLIIIAGGGVVVAVCGLVIWLLSRRRPQGPGGS